MSTRREFLSGVGAAACDTAAAVAGLQKIGLKVLPFPDEVDILRFAD